MSLDVRTNAAQAEAIGAAIAHKLGGDAVQNIDRILRLPGTVNLPDAKKRARGRVPRAAKLSRTMGELHTLDELAAWAPPRPLQSKKAPAAPVDLDMERVDSVTSFDDLSADLKTRFADHQKRDPRLARLWAGDRSAYPGDDDSRSGFAFVFASVLRRSGKFSATEYGMLMRTWDQVDPTTDARQLSRAWANTRAISAEEEFKAVDAPPTAPKRFNIINAADTQWSADAQPYWIDGLLAPRMVGLITGVPNAGKTPLGLDIAAHQAVGKPWRNRKTRQGYVLHVATEGWSGLANRREAIRREHLAGMERPPLEYLDTRLNLRAGGDAKALAAEVEERASSFDLPPALVVIDTLSPTLGGGTDRDDDVARAVIANCQHITATGAALILVHHPTKSGDSSYRGSSVWIDDTDLQIDVAFDRRTGVRTLKTERVKDFEAIQPLTYRIQSVELGRSSEGDLKTAPIIDWSPTEFADTSVTGLTPEEEDALDAIENTLSEHDNPPNGVRHGVWLESFCRVRGVGTEDRGVTSKFNRARKALVHAGYVKQTHTGQYVRTDLVR